MHVPHVATDVLSWQRIGPDTPVVRVLLECGADTNMQDVAGQTPLQRASSKKDTMISCNYFWITGLRIIPHVL